MQNPKMRNCADGTMRADNGALLQRNDVNGLTVTPKTTAYTVTANDTGLAFNNAAAGGSVTFTLPTPKGGEWFIFIKTASQIVVVSAPAGVTLNGLATLTSASAGTEAGKAFIRVFAISATEYLAMTQGTWTLS